MIPITKPSLNNDDLKHLKKVLKSKILTDGYYQNKTELLIKKLIKSNYVGLTHSCTAGLEISAILINLKPGDEVITPSFTYIATTEVIALLGLRPVFVEVDPNTFCIDPESLSAALTSKTKAIVPVHLYGQSANMEAIMSFAKANNFWCPK